MRAGAALRITGPAVVGRAARLPVKADEPYIEDRMLDPAGGAAVDMSVSRSTLWECTLNAVD